jgi:hypothetical protein
VETLRVCSTGEREPATGRSSDDSSRDRHEIQFTGQPLNKPLTPAARWRRRRADMGVVGLAAI